MCSNRTFMELTLDASIRGAMNDIGSNRTFMELKCRDEYRNMCKCRF